MNTWPDYFTPGEAIASNNLTKGIVMDFSEARIGERLWDAFRGYVVVEGVDDMHIFVSDGWGPPTKRRIDGVSVGGEQILYWSKPTITGGDIPPKRTVKKKVEGGVLVHKNGRFGSVFVTEIEANWAMVLAARGAKILKIETEIEVEE